MGEKQGFMTSVVALASQKWGVGWDWPLGRGMGVTEVAGCSFGNLLRRSNYSNLLQLLNRAPFRSSETLSAMPILKTYSL